MLTRTLFIFLLISCSLFGMERQNGGAGKKKIFDRVVKIKGAKLTFFVNQELHHNQDVDRIVIALQGVKREAETRVKAVMKAARSRNFAKKILVISPYFKIDTDEKSNGEMFWTKEGWKQGDDSKDSSRRSSFAVVDTIIKRILKRNIFPNVKKIIVTGHSAGGQFTQRYALTTGLPELYPSIDFTFVVMNPSSYAYLNNYRPIENYNVARRYNDYKYGLENLNPYASLFTVRELQKQYLERQVFYVLGEADNDPNDDMLDKSKAASLQGNNRLSRGELYYEQLNKYFPHHHHKLVTIPKVGHEAAKMYDAESVKDILFAP